MGIYPAGADDTVLSYVTCNLCFNLELKRHYAIATSRRKCPSSSCLKRKLKTLAVTTALRIVPNASEFGVRYRGARRRLITFGGAQPSGPRNMQAPSIGTRGAGVS